VLVVGEGDWIYYSSGVYDNPACSQEISYSMLIVGWSTVNGSDYWIVKNSMGQSWGNEGYIYFARANGTAQSVCGLNLLPTYPIDRC